jgi:cell division protein FtsN
MKAQRGGFVLGMIVGLLVGLSIALGVALYITKAPVPFVNKVPQRTAEQDQAEQARNRNWDPNAPLAGKAAKPVAPAQGPASEAGMAPALAGGGASSPAPGTAVRPGRDPAAILSGAATPGLPAASAAAPAARGPEAFAFFVQAGAYTRADEAEQQRAKLAMLGQPAKITEREQNGRVVYRVRVGPIDTRPDAERLQGKLQQSGIETQLVRVER